MNRNPHRSVMQQGCRDHGIWQRFNPSFISTNRAWVEIFDCLSLASVSCCEISSTG
ncbi:hypothetical protein [Rubritalea tangerina]|uniref:hypothetical protein n=1 Tax=Rubritalea tangerina TaxID=430798 RepID=UPI00361E9CF9